MVGGTEARHGRRGRTHRRAGRLAIMIVGRSLRIQRRRAPSPPPRRALLPPSSAPGPHIVAGMRVLGRPGAAGGSKIRGLDMFWAFQRGGIHGPRARLEAR